MGLSKFLVVGLMVGMGFAAFPAQAATWQCDLVATDDLSESCMLGALFGRETVIGLHYGSLITQALVVEIVRAEATSAQLTELARAVAVELQVSTPDFTARYRVLEGKVVGDRLVYNLGDSNESSFYISMLQVRGLSESVNHAVQKIFGPRAVGLISAERRKDRA